MPPITSSTAKLAFALSVTLASGTLISSVMPNRWQARRESNPQPAVLETAALPIELLACIFHGLRPTYSLHDFGDNTGADRLATLTDGEAQPLLHRNRADQLDVHLDVVPRHDHLGPFRQLHQARHIRRAEVKLRPVPLEERRVASALLLRQHVHLGLERGVRSDRARLRQHLAPLHFLALRATQQHSHVVSRLPLIEQLAEHL